MDIKEFTKNAIEQISEAVEEVNNTSKRKTILHTSQEKRTIEFDLAVTVEEKIEGGGKGGIKVLGFITAEGGGTKEIISSTVSRIQFGVDVSPLLKNEGNAHVGGLAINYNRGR